MIVCGTGHRPEMCESETIIRFKVRCYLNETKPNTFITGMAAGFDLYAADEARKLGIEVWAARPWAGHRERRGDEYLYKAICNYASKTINVSESNKFPGKYCYHARNQWMVDNSDEVCAYWDGASSGGTYACLSYAVNVAKKQVTNIYDYPPF